MYSHLRQLSHLWRIMFPVPVGVSKHRFIKFPSTTDKSKNLFCLINCVLNSLSLLLWLKIRGPVQGNLHMILRPSADSNCKHLRAGKNPKILENKLLPHLVKHVSN